VLGLRDVGSGDLLRVVDDLAVAQVVGSQLATFVVKRSYFGVVR